jgi:hypothetical protein
MRMFIMWHPPDGWVEEVNDETQAKGIIARQFPSAAYSVWCPVFPACPDSRMFVWESHPAGQSGARPIAWIITVS